MSVADGRSPNSVQRVSRIAIIALVLTTVGAGSTIAAAFTPWYTISNSTHNYVVENQSLNISSTMTFYLGSNYRYYCAVAPASAPIWGPICAQTQPAGVLEPYSDLVFQTGAGRVYSSLATLYGDLPWLSGAAGAFGAAALGLQALTLRRGSRPNLRLAAASVAVLAGVLALAAVVGVALEQPAAIAHDCQYLGVGCSADASFWGSCGPTLASCGTNAPSNITEQTQWGPAYGWYLETLAGILFIAVAIVTLLAPRGPRGAGKNAAPV